MSMILSCQCCAADFSFFPAEEGEICPNCGWEQDFPEDLERPFGPNGMTLSQYREGLSQFSDSDPVARKHAMRMAMNASNESYERDLYASEMITSMDEMHKRVASQRAYHRVFEAFGRINERIGGCFDLSGEIYPHQQSAYNRLCKASFNIHKILSKMENEMELY